MSTSKYVATVRCFPVSKKWMLRSLARRHFRKICTPSEPRLIRLEKSSVFMFHGCSFSARNGFLRHREPRLQQGQLGAEGQKSDGGPTHFFKPSGRRKIWRLILAASAGCEET